MSEALIDSLIGYLEGRIHSGISSLNLVEKKIELILNRRSIQDDMEELEELVEQNRELKTACKSYIELQIQLRNSLGEKSRYTVLPIEEQSGILLSKCKGSGRILLNSQIVFDGIKMQEGSLIKGIQEGIYAPVRFEVYLEALEQDCIRTERYELCALIQSLKLAVN